MKRQHTTVAMAVVLFLAVRILGSALISVIGAPFDLLLEALCMLLSGALPACLFIGGRTNAIAALRTHPFRREHLRYFLLLPLSIVSVSLLASAATYLAELCGYQNEILLPSDPIRLFLLAVILPALVEEFLCRHLCFAPFAEESVTSAVWVSAILFALLHANFVQIPYAFFAGLIFGALVGLTKSLWFPILFHFSNNLVSVSFSLLGESSFGAKLLEGSLLALAALSIPLLLRPGKNGESSVLGDLWRIIRPHAADGKKILEHLLSPLLIPIVLCLWLSLLG